MTKQPLEVSKSPHPFPESETIREGSRSLFLWPVIAIALIVSLLWIVAQLV